MLSSLIQDMSAQLERSPTIAELAEAAGVEEEEVVEALESSRAYTAESLTAPAEEGSELDRMQTLGVVEEAFERTEDRAARGRDRGPRPPRAPDHPAALLRRADADADRERARDLADARLAPDPAGARDDAG